MSDVTGTAGGRRMARDRSRATDPVFIGYQILHWVFVALPTIVGLDKFFHLLANWNGYLAPQFARLSPLPVNTTMRVLGCVEIVAGLIVALRPRIGGFLVALWLLGIIVNLLVARDFYDIVIRDAALASCAVALGFMATRLEHQREVPARTD